MNKNKSNYKTIPLVNNTKLRLNSFGKKGQTYDEILNELLDQIEQENAN